MRKKILDTAQHLLQHIAALMLCCATPAFAAPPASVQVSYDIFKSGIPVGRIDESYSRNRDRYTLTSTTTPVGLLAMFKPEKIFIKSNGLIDKQGLQPLLFSHQREHDHSKDNRAEFDWPNKRLLLVHQQQHDTVALPDGTQDRLSAMYQFMFLNLQADTALDFAMTNGNKLDQYHYAVSGPQHLDTPAGEFNALYLDNQAKPGESRNEIWLCMDHHNLPCKMIITDANGDQLTQVLRKLTVKP